MKSDRLWVGLAVVVIWALDQTWVRTHPGATSLLGREGPLSMMILAVLAGMVLWLSVPLLWQRLLGAVGRGEPRFFAPDPADTEQVAADAELERITKMTDEAESDRAWQAWLVGERRREEARFVKRREWARASRAAMKSYVKAIRAEIELDRTMIDEDDPADSMRDDVKRLEEELVWAEAELERMPNS